MHNTAQPYAFCHSAGVLIQKFKLTLYFKQPERSTGAEALRSGALLARMDGLQLNPRAKPFVLTPQERGKTGGRSACVGQLGHSGAFGEDKVHISAPAAPACTRDVTSGKDMMSTKQSSGWCGCCSSMHMTWCIWQDQGAFQAERVAMIYVALACT